jgi:hypothetical protein
MAPILSSSISLGAGGVAPVLQESPTSAEPEHENPDFEQLLADGVYELLFVWAPQKMVGATGSPRNPVALY